MADVPSPRKLVNTLFLLALVGSAGAGAYLAENLYYRPMREKEILIGNLKEIVDHMTRDRRVAEIKVLEQTPEYTRFKFQELDDDKEPLSKAREFTVPGHDVYFDMLVVKFNESFKPLDELPLKQAEIDKHLLNKSIFFFLRVFSNKLKPEDGFPIDKRNEPPRPYSIGKGMTGLEEQLWKDFWTLAADPKKAAERGVRAAHGQAVWTRFEPNKYYVIEVRANGESTIKPVDLPAVLR
jgi:hypothetical protein